MTYQAPETTLSPDAKIILGNMLKEYLPHQKMIDFLEDEHAMDAYPVDISQDVCEELYSFLHDYEPHYTVFNDKGIKHIKEALAEKDITPLFFDAYIEDISDKCTDVLFGDFPREYEVPKLDLYIEILPEHLGYAFAEV